MIPKIGDDLVPYGVNLSASIFRVLLGAQAKLNSLLERQGVHGIETQVFWSLQALKGRDKKNLTVFDVGGHRGEFSLEVLRQSPNSRIYVFEPSSQSAGYLGQMFQEEPNVTVIDVGLGEVRGEARLFFDFTGSALASINRRRLDHFNIDFNEYEVVQLETIDYFCETKLVYPDLIKIDVEGSELSVLKGGINTLRHVSAVQFEFGGTHIDSRTFFQDFWYFLKEFEFELFEIGRFGVRHIAKYSENEEKFTYRNFLAIKGSLVTALT